MAPCFRAFHTAAASRRARRLLPVLTLALIGAPAASAQQLYRFEVSGGPGYHSFDKATQLGGSIGGTLRAGYWFYRGFGIEVEGSLTNPSTKTIPSASVGITSLSGALLGNLMIQKLHSVYLRVGYGSVSYGKCPTIATPNDPICGSAGAFQGAIGGRYALSPTVMIRGEGLISRSQTSLKFSNLVFNAGVSLMIGSQPLVDSDGDHVYDRYDKCPSTPLGAIVDARGCATDTDHDGVFDGLDRCPNTPAGASVDKVGCPADADNDGILDGVDRCPDTPAGATVDSSGCAPDTDKDGVPDGLDRCPGTAPGATVDKLGCPSDADNDGVPDGIDKCPTTPAGTTVNLFGCPVNQDSDKDGVSDAVDRCPNTAVGVRIDATGCPPTPAIQPAPPTPQQNPPAPTPQAAPAVPAAKPPTPAAAPQPGGARSWVVPGTAFAIRSNKLLGAGFPVLDSVVTMLLSNPFLKVEIGGHAQDRLVPAENLKLSVQRAEAVRDYIVSKGVPSTRLTVKGYGSTAPLVADSSDAGRVQNRRVEIRPFRN